MHRLFPVLVLATSAAAGAQNLVLNDAQAGVMNELAAVSPMYPAGGLVLSNSYAHVPMLPPAWPWGGAVTIDSTNGETWFTDGFTIAVMNHNGYTLGPLPPVPQFPVPQPAGPAGPPVTGMALDPLLRVLWVTDGTLLAGAVLAPPPPVTWVVLPALPGGQIMFPPLTGLEWDPLSGSLWACDQAGFVYNILPVPGFPIVGTFPPVGGVTPPVLGITLDKTGAGGLYVTGGGMIVDYASGTVFPSLGAGPEVGMTSHPVPASAPAGMPGGVCKCPAVPSLGLQLLGPMTLGNPAFGVDVTGVAPNQLVIWGFDFGAPGPAPYPVFNTVGCGFGLTLTSFGAAIWANAAGTATLPIPLGGGSTPPVGLTVYMQAVTPCPGDSLGVVLTPMFQFVVSAP